MAERVVTDVVGDDLVKTYLAAARRLESLVAAGLRRGLDPDRVGAGEQVRGDATQAYRDRQLRAVRALLAELQGVHERAPGIVADAYRSTLLAIDELVTEAGNARPRFGGVHQGAVEVLAGNLERSLRAVAEQTRQSVETVFARAAALEGALPAEGIGRTGFIGRRVDDPWRRLALRELAAGQATLETRRQVTARLARRLIDEGVTDALTGFVDRAGKRWALDTYAEMAVRTTTREATSRATVNRLVEHGLGAITISSHPHREDVCTPYDGKTFAIPGTDEATRGRFPVIDNLPPFHGRCRHVTTPAGVDFDDFERELADATGASPLEGATPPPEGFAPPPFGTRPRPSTGPDTQARGRLQQDAYAFDDPGEEPGALEAWEAAMLSEDRRATRRQRARARAADRALDEELGADLKQALDDFADAGVKWARDADLKRALIAGETSIEDVTELAERELTGLMDRRGDRARLEGNRGLRQGSFSCFVCGRFKRRPSDICDNCGDDPVTYGGDAGAFDEAYGYDRLGARDTGGSLNVRGRGILLQ